MLLVLLVTTSMAILTFHSECSVREKKRKRDHDKRKSSDHRRSHKSRSRRHQTPSHRTETTDYKRAFVSLDDDKCSSHIAMGNVDDQLSELSVLTRFNQNMDDMLEEVEDVDLSMIYGHEDDEG